VPLGKEVGLGLGDIVLDGAELSIAPKRGRSPPIFGPCPLRKTTGWIKMALGIEVGLGRGHIVLDGNPAPSPKR